MNRLVCVVALFMMLMMNEYECKVLSKDDCVDLWNVVGGRGDVFDSLRKVQTKGIASDQNSIVSLWEACLRMEEGIRFRRSETGPKPASSSLVPGSVNGNSNTALLRYLLTSKYLNNGNQRSTISIPFSDRQETE